MAAEALRRIAELYAIEATIRGQPADARKNVRRAESLPLVKAMKMAGPRAGATNGHPMSRLGDLLPWNWTSLLAAAA